MIQFILVCPIFHVMQCSCSPYERTQAALTYKIIERCPANYNRHVSIFTFGYWYTVSSHIFLEPAIFFDNDLVSVGSDTIYEIFSHIFLFLFYGNSDKNINACCQIVRQILFATYIEFIAAPNLYVDDIIHITSTILCVYLPLKIWDSMK